MKKVYAICRLLSLLAIMMILVSALSAQTKKVLGVIKDTSGSPLGGASILVNSERTLGITDDYGKFSIDVPESASSIIVSLIGYERKTVILNGDFLNIVLVAEHKEGNEVIVTALGVRREARSIGYTVQKVSGSDITKASAPDLATGLMGKSAGLNISVPNGVQGSSQRIVIRGNNSILGSNQALIVVDGIQVQNDPVGGSQSNTSSVSGNASNLENQKDWGSFMNSLNPDDVQDVTVLKGATAAALYGARGANGVILITTKKGTESKGLGLDYNFSALYNNPYRYMDVQNEYGMGLANAMWSATSPFKTNSAGNLVFPDPWTDMYASIPGGYQAYELFSWFGRGASWGHKLDGTEIVWWDGVKRKWDAQPDNRKAFYRTGSTLSHNVSFSKTGDFGSVRFSYTRQDNKAILKNSDYQQNNFNLGSNLNISKKLRAEITASFNNYTRKNAPDLGQDFGWSTFTVYNMSREYKPLEFSTYKNADGSKVDFDGVSVVGDYPYDNNYNKSLFWHLMEQNQRMTKNQLLGTAKLTADFTSWFNLTGRTSLNLTNTTVESKYSPIDAAGLQGQYGIESIKNQDVNLELFGNLHKDNLFGSDLNANLLIGAGALKSRMYDNNAWNSGESGATYGQSSNYPWIVPYKYFLANTSGTGILTKEYWNDYNINSLYGVLDLSYKNYLFLQVTGRNDWSSTLPIDNASYFYPSASLSFVFTDAIKGFKDISWLNYGKLKASYAKSANGAQPYQSVYTYSANVVTNYNNGQVSQTFGGMPVRSQQSILPPAELLKPQQNRSQEFGLELGMFNSRLNLEFNYYYTKATDQILNANVAPSSGSNQVTFNTGAISNKGFEFIIRGTPIKTNDFKWDVTINGAHNQNKVLSLSDGIDIFPLQDLWGNNGVRMYVKAGENYGTIYGYDYTYLNGKKVVEQIKDKNDPNKVVGTRYVTTSDLVPIGNATAKLTGGVANNFRYKNLSLYVMADFKIGGQIYSADYAASMAQGLAPETLKERNGGGLPYTYADGSSANHGVILDGVFADGTPNTDVVHYMYKYAGQYGAWSNVPMPRSNAIFTNSWGKLRELNLTYSLPRKMIASMKFVQGLDVSLIGRNLFYIFSTLPDHLNPEAINGIGNGQGIQWAQLPGVRDIGFSVKVKF